MKKLILCLCFAISGCAGHTWLACDADFVTFNGAEWSVDFTKENSTVLFPTDNAFSYTIDGVQKSSPSLSPKGSGLYGEDYNFIYSVYGKTYAVRDKQKGQGLIIKNCRSFANL